MKRYWKKKYHHQFGALETGDYFRFKGLRKVYKVLSRESYGIRYRSEKGEVFRGLKTSNSYNSIVDVLTYTYTAPAKPTRKKRKL